MSFASSDESVVSVSDDGKISGVENGSTIITATEKEDGDVVRTFDCQVEVNDGMENK